MDAEGAENCGDDAMTSIIDTVVEAVMDLIDSMGNFATIKRGALSTKNSLTCEIAPSTVNSVFMDKNAYIALDLTINAKNNDLQKLSATLNNIVDNLTRRKSYPDGNGWEIVDICTGAPPVPTIIDREDENMWIMAASVIVKVYRKDDE